MSKNNNNDPYIPIECGLHSSYELTIMHKTCCLINWHSDDNTNHTATVLPLDIITRDKQEFLVVRELDDETPFEVRLDKITLFEPA